ncbi:MAG: plasmid pRiA4b ORF-3 family protein, partial [Bacteroidaceae bacterium]|nr:plasmid pRiA4b ORF-3 family protein [Bacteroidaceae bacterium]
MAIQFKIQIRDIKKPPVWRRIVIPGNFTFHDLHNTIQSAFGWWDEHLYQFQRHPFDGGWTVKELDDEDDNWGERPEDARETNVLTFIQHMGLEKFVYVYDFGDSWVHDITVEKIDHDANLDHPVCLAGKGACPPEDCGGPWGYEELKEEMDKDEINEFDLEEVNEELESITAGSEWSGNTIDSMWDEENDMPRDIKELEGKTLADLMENQFKGSLTDFSEELGFDIDESISEKEFRKQYAQALKDNVVRVMSMLPISELKLLEHLKKNPKPGNTLDCYEDYCSKLMVIYGLAGEWRDEDENYYIWVPDDLWQMMKPHVEEVLADPHVQHRVTIENTILGLANLYGQVSLGFVEKELVRLGQVQTIEGAKIAVSACMDDSLLLKFTQHQTGRLIDEPSEDTLLFLSPYGWDMPSELDDEIKKRESLAKDYHLFT